MSVVLFGAAGAQPGVTVTIVFPAGVDVTAVFPNGPETAANVGVTIDALTGLTVDETVGRMGTTVADTASRIGATVGVG